MARMVDCGAGPRRELAEARRREKARSKRLWMLFLFLLSVGAASAAASALTHMRLFRVILIAACAALAFFPLCISGSGSSRISVLSAGAAGEEDAAALLSNLPDEYTVFRNAVAARWEIDFIVVGPTGVFAIEVKAYSGTLLGDYSEQQWLKRKRSHMGKVYEKYVSNPLLQARRGAAALSRELLRRGERIYVNGAVYLAGGECTAEITGDPPCERLFSHYDELLDFITENPRGISPRAEKNICGIIRDIAGL